MRSSGGSRSRTWLLYFVGWIVAGILWSVATALGVIAFIIMFGLSLALIVPSIALAIRRLHDTNKSGWWLLIGLIPFGGIVLLVFYILEGTNGPNDHGAARRTRRSSSLTERSVTSGVRPQM